MRRASALPIAPVALFAPWLCIACGGPIVEAEDLSLDITGDEAPTSTSTGTDSDTESTSDTTTDTTTDTTGTTGDPDSFRVAIFADSHVVGPEYQGGDENLLSAAMQLEGVRWEIEHIVPPPDFAVIIGDLVHDAYPTDDQSFYEQNPSAFSIVDDILTSFPVPVYQVFGERDYAVPKFPRTLSHALFAYFFVKEPYYAVDHGGWRFVFSNSQYGPTFDPMTVFSDTTKGSYGPVQLTWLADKVDDGVPTVVFSHFPIGSTVVDEAVNNAPYPDMRSLLSAAADVELIFTGHSHVWTSTPAEFGAPHYEVGATRYDTDNFILMEFNLDGSYEFLDIDKVQWNTPNADHWVYDQGTPMPAP